MKTLATTSTMALLAATLLVTPAAVGQEQDHEAHHPETEAPAETPAMPGMMGRGMMDPETMREMMRGMMGEGQMDPEMRERMRAMMEERGMRPGMMGPGMMGPGMMGPEMMHGMMESMMRGMAEGLARGLVEGAIRAHGMGPEGKRGHRTGERMRGERGMMGGIGPGMLYGMPGEPTVDTVRAMVEGRLARHGNPRLRLGEVVEHEDGTITAEIETVDGSLVQRLAVDSQTGRLVQAD